jgi:hypothetical protein
VLISAVVCSDPFPVTPLGGKSRSKAFIDVAIGHDEPKRIVVELAVRLPTNEGNFWSLLVRVLLLLKLQDDVVPQTVENFKRVRRCLCLFLQSPPALLICTEPMSSVIVM